MFQRSRKKSNVFSVKSAAPKLAALLAALACGLTACGTGEEASSGGAESAAGSSGTESVVSDSASSVAPSSGEETAPKKEIAVTVFKTGKADCILLELDGAYALIDTAEKDDGDEMAAELRSRGITRLDLMLLTHLDKDHIGGAPDILDNFEIGRLVQADYDEDSKRYEDYQEAVERSGLAPVRLKEPMELELGGAQLTLTPGQYPPYADDNDYSIIAEMAYGANRFLFAGDAEEQRLSEFIATGEGGYDFLKVPHHGRANPLSNAFFTIVMPKIAVITCSDKNPAEEEVLSALAQLDAQVYLTADGTVTVRTDGETITAQQ